MESTRNPTAGSLRLHQFIAGALPAAAYLFGWSPPVWVALALSAAALVSCRLALVSRLHMVLKPSQETGGDRFHYGIYRTDELVRAVLLACGLALLALGRPIGWLPVLAASATAILQGVSGFSVTMVLYAVVKYVVSRKWRDKAAWAETAPSEWNTDCLVCRVLAGPPQERCRWCRLEGIRWCCGLQISLLLMLLMVIAFLLNASLGVLVTKLLVTMSVLGVVALGLAISRQTDALIRSLDETAQERQREADRCDFLRRLSLADSVESAAETMVGYISQAVGARRVSVMVPEGDVLRIAASRGIPHYIVSRVAVPVSTRICGQVFSTGRAVVFSNVESEEPDAALGLKLNGPSVSVPMVAAPMGAAGRRVGCINATDLARGELSQADVAELEFTAEAGAISLAAHLARREVERANYDTIRALALALEARDLYTHGHSRRVQTWAVAIGGRLGLGEEALEVLSQAAELHDVGKLAVPDEVLKGARKLTEAEWVLVRQHPFRGVQMIQHVGFLRPALPAILHHHERVDGTGYPEGLSGDQIPLESRILAVVDAYDAMTSARPYRPAMSHEEAAAELRRCIGTQFDPACAEALLEVLEEETREAVGAGAGSFPTATN